MTGAGVFVRTFLATAILFFSASSFAYAGVLSFFGRVLIYERGGGENSQNINLLEPARNQNPRLSRGGGEVTIVDHTALLPDFAPFQSDDVGSEGLSGGQISVYVVRQGETLSEIANMFGVTTNTIRWANDMPRTGGVSAGQKLVILPISGVRHAVKKGDTVAGIAAKYKGDKDEVIEFNDLAGRELSLGEVVVVPHGLIEVAPVATSKKTAVSVGVSVSAQVGYYARPIAGGVKTQGIHGYNGIDLGAPIGTPVLAAAAGEVIVSKDGWNGGYGKYIVIKHSNGTQTVYAHLSSNLVAAGATVAKGENIALSGNTGRSTGPHLHFEVRGAKNPF